MSTVVCYDADGKYLEHFTQWDIGRKIVLKGVDAENVVELHFCNQYTDEAIVVAADVQGTTVSADVPDIVLQHGVPLSVHIYCQDDAYSAATVYTVVIPVYPRQKPSGYTYEEKRTDSLALLNLIYPVGSVYLSTSAIVPDSYLVGRWERIKDYVLVASGDTYQAGVPGEFKASVLDDNNVSFNYMPIYAWKRIA